MRTFTPEKLIKYKICWRFPQRTPQKRRSPTYQI